MSDGSSEMVRQLIAEIGDKGLAEIPRDPGLAAAVDQHSAAVRDVIIASGDRPGADELLDYLHGFTDAALERGWWPAGEFDWETVRIVAVYALMRRLRAG